jgi:hypothetical protein
LEDEMKQRKKGERKKGEMELERKYEWEKERQT